ncbi:hypothetical protein SAMN02745163_01227 [Clostridium cavendishii DSM 21758]|uniref:DUF5050 domain-containing protein n=1 Tax=Clostridium cavendishii DSM 21758 TaxID=1121302 RepID=A0A1M6GA48_9CLOT|nr:hypothetical protein [Clostridium cavendishii]SHJ06833.1 hypothetical protein SAMN02745163_01227 [Clostridium cavendishii DSM 21758]
MIDNKKNFLRNIIIAISVILIIVISVGTYMFFNSKKTKATEESKFYFYKNDQNTASVYTLDKDNKLIKLDKDNEQVYYVDKLRQYILINKNKEMSFVDEKGHIIEIDKDVQGGVKINGDKIYYIKNNKELYLKKGLEGKSEKIGENIEKVSIISDNIIKCLDKDYKTIIKKDDKDIIKELGIFDAIKFNKDYTKCVYSKDKSLVEYDIKAGTEKKIVEPKIDTKEAYLGCYSIEDDNILYGIIKTKKDEPRINIDVWYKEKGKEPKEILKDCKGVLLSEDEKGVYYTNNIGTLFYKDLKKGEEKRLMDDVEFFLLTTKDYIIVTSSKGENYKVNNNGTNEKLKSKDKIILVKKFKDSYAYFNEEDSSIYIDGKKTIENVKKYSIVNDDIAYVNNDNEVYLVKNGDIKNPKLILKNVKEYDVISFGESTLFMNLFDIDDIKGYWRDDVDQNEAIYITKENYKTLIYYHGNNNFKISKISTPDKDKIALELENEEYKVRTISKTKDKDLISVDGRNYRRIDKETYKKIEDLTKYQMEVLNPKANQYLNAWAPLNKVIKKDNMIYFEYINPNPPNQKVYIREDGTLFDDPLTGSEIKDGKSNDNKNKDAVKNADPELVKKYLKVVEDNDPLSGNSVLRSKYELNDITTYEGKKYYVFNRVNDKRYLMYIDEDENIYNVNGTIEKNGLIKVHRRK